MALPAGRVTEPFLGLTDVHRLPALGSGALRQQAVMALRSLLGPMLA